MPESTCAIPASPRAALGFNQRHDLVGGLRHDDRGAGRVPGDQFGGHWQSTKLLVGCAVAGGLAALVHAGDHCPRWQHQADMRWRIGIGVRRADGAAGDRGDRSADVAGRGNCLACRRDVRVSTAGIRRIRGVLVVVCGTGPAARARELLRLAADAANCGDHSHGLGRRDIFPIIGGRHTRTSGG